MMAQGLCEGCFLAIAAAISTTFISSSVQMPPKSLSIGSESRPLLTEPRRLDEANKMGQQRTILRPEREQHVDIPIA